MIALPASTHSGTHPCLVANTEAIRVRAAEVTYPNSVALGDLNGDDKLDLAVAKFGSASVSLLLGAGDAHAASP
jgi:hypothetical protein